jgi:16S rRNA (guanine527-N7)-methyltransferase
VSETEFDWERRIRERARASGIELDDSGATALATQVRWILRSNTELHLTSITEPEEFLERHLGESFEGVALLDPSVAGEALDLGSGNGYPGLPLAAIRTGLRVTLAEASRRKALFLRQVIEATALLNAVILEGQIQRAPELEGLGPFRVITSRAMGGWPKVLPRLAPVLAPDGEILIWAGEETESIAKRVVWRKFELVDRRALPDREQSWIWRFRLVS